MKLMRSRRVWDTSEGIRRRSRWWTAWSLWSIKKGRIKQASLRGFLLFDSSKFILGYRLSGVFDFPTFPSSNPLISPADSTSEADPGAA